MISFGVCRFSHYIESEKALKNLDFVIFFSVDFQKFCLHFKTTSTNPRHLFLPSLLFSSLLRNCEIIVLKKYYFQAEEITLTIGQAFDLAYRRFIETSGKDMETQRHLMLLQQKLKCLENENSVLRQRLSDISKIKGTVNLRTCLLLLNFSKIF